MELTLLVSLESHVLLKSMGFGRFFFGHQILDNLGNSDLSGILLGKLLPAKLCYLCEDLIILVIECQKLLLHYILYYIDWVTKAQIVHSPVPCSTVMVMTTVRMVQVELGLAVEY